MQNHTWRTELAANRIAFAARVALSNLPPYWLVIVLWWLIVFGSSKEIEALTLMYMVLSETIEKRD